MAKRTMKPAPDTPTIAVLAESYIAALQFDGRSTKTADSYAADLKVAAKYLGQDTDIRALTKERVQEFFDAPVVVQKRDGSPKNAISIAKTRRILRLALTWAADSGWIDEAPIPTPAKAERIEPDIDDAPIALAGYAPKAAADSNDLPEPPGPALNDDPVADLPRFDHEAMTPDLPAEPATPAPKAAKATKKSKKAKAS